MNPAATVGRPLRIEGLVLPGTRLEPAADPDRAAPLAVRISAAAPHGDRLRYDLEVTVWEPGTHDLRPFLRRADGSGTADLPEIPVTAASLLAPGAPVVSRPAPSLPADLGGYRQLVGILAALWIIGLAVILLATRRRRPDDGRPAGGPPTPADRLAALLATARATPLSTADTAEIERLVYDAWRRELALDAAPPKQLVERLRRDPHAAMALDRLAGWLHAPGAESPADIAGFVARLLPPAPRAARPAEVAR